MYSSTISDATPRLLRPNELAGLGIAYVAALGAKVNVLVYDKSTDQVDRGLRLMDKLLAKDVAKGRLVDYEAKEARARVQVVPQDKGLAGLRDVDMVVEVRGTTSCLSATN